MRNRIEERGENSRMPTGAINKIVRTGGPMALSLTSISCSQEQVFNVWRGLYQEVFALNGHGEIFYGVSAAILMVGGMAIGINRLLERRRYYISRNLSSTKMEGKV